MLIEGQLARSGERATGKLTARGACMEQQPVEQAYAAAIRSAGSTSIIRTVVSGRLLTGLATGILLDEESERHLLKATEDRVAVMQQKIGSGVAVESDSPHKQHADTTHKNRAPTAPLSHSHGP